MYRRPNESIFRCSTLQDQPKLAGSSAIVSIVKMKVVDAHLTNHSRRGILYTPESSGEITIDVVDKQVGLLAQSERKKGRGIDNS